MAAKTSIDIQNDERGRIVYDRQNKDHAVYTPAGQLLGYTTTPTAARETLDAWHYEEARARHAESVAAAIAEYQADIDQQVAFADAGDEGAFWRAQQRAFAKAACYAAEGVVVVASGTGYNVPSASRPGAIVHRLYQVGGVWVCGCEAGAHGRFCWHSALLACHLRALELAEPDAIAAMVAA